MTPSTTPLPLSKKLSAMGVREESVFWYSSNGGIFQPIFPNRYAIASAYQLGELPAVLKAIGKVKGWRTVEQFDENLKIGRVDEWRIKWNKLCRHYSDSPEKGWEYLEELLK